MTTLAETLSALLAQATRARVEADRETARIALMYQQDELLRTMPVPRFRLPTLTIDLPMAIVGLAPSTPLVVEVLPLDRTDVWQTRVLEQLRAELQLARYELVTDDLRGALGQHIARWRVAGVAVQATTIHDALAAVLAVWPATPETTEPPVPFDALPALRTAMRTAAIAVTRPMLIVQAAPPPSTPPPLDVQVEVGTVALRELGAGAQLTMVRLQVSEEGVEVVQVENRGATERRLSPE